MLAKRRIAQLHAVELSRFEQIKLTAPTGTKGVPPQRIADLANALLNNGPGHLGTTLDSKQEPTRRMGRSTGPWWTDLDPQIRLKSGRSAVRSCP
jgi:hypothetical protein